jgi:UDP-N-acetylmuramoyl-tripeptide--D-alanyl-D-alanine ligase
MISLTLDKLAEVLGAAPSEAADASFRGVTIDSRQDCEGRLFVAIAGDNFDGHEFVEAALRKGASAALVQHRQPCDIPQVVVDDCRHAMGQLANYWRHQCDPRMVALTGSNGKTTVKEMLYRILQSQAKTLATRGNFNNDIGLPLTLFELDGSETYAVIEMGANHRGEIARLCEIAEPDIVYVNNVGAAHLEGFGGIQGVIEAKGEIYAYCGPEQKALFNVDEPACHYWREHCAAGVQLGCGLDRPAEVSANWSSADGGVVIEFSYLGETARCQIEVIGEHNVRNALAAVSLALLAGVELASAADGLAGFTGVKGRLQGLPGPRGSRLIDDSYNANPDSLEAGIKVLCALDGESWLALGDMGELGPDAEELHREAAHCARQHGVDRFFGFGAMSSIASREFGDGGTCYDDIQAMADAILAQIHAGVNLLVKGSRAAHMERLVDRLTQTGHSGDANAV